MLPNTSSRPKNRNRLWLVIAVIIAAILVWYFAFHHSSSSAPEKHAGQGRGGMRGAAMAGAQTPVQAGKAEQADVPVYLRALGTVVANATVTVTSRVDGQLMKVYFTEGQKVEQGQLLAQIDPRSYQATLEQYQGDLAQNQALAKSAELTLARYKKLYAQDSLARQDLESQMATAGQYAGAVKADQAQIAAAKLNLEFAKITAPVSGHVGLRLVDPGNMVTSGSTTGIVTITQTQPIAVTFSVPQSNLQTLLKALRGGQQLPTTAFDQDGSEVLGQGKLQFISNEIDTSTGSIKLKALFDNQDEKLYPNQFVNARLQVGTLEKATVIPAAALQLSANGDFVYVVKADNSVERREVKSGPAFGDDKVAILSGIQLGEQVVTTGIDHLNNGSKVQVVTASAEDEATASKAGSSKQRAEQGGVDKATTGKDSGSK
ncbi:MdtA/MuxA family multidrug efflux RND transporter periplasmic adaptor subunit [Ewingella sp. AOP8-B2-18]